MKKGRTVKVNKIFVTIVLFLFVIMMAKLSYIVLSPKVDGINLKAFALNRNTVTEKIVAERGTIYDKLGNALAVDVNSYTVIAYLEESRTTDPENPQHVVDKEITAKALSPLINMTEERILSLLNTKGAYQVELGPGGRGITELLKEQIEELDLPGIDFIKSVKRYYPNGDYLSNTLGYAKSLEDGSIVGEMGLELRYDEELTGENGSRTYEGDIYGYKIANTKENIVKAEDGHDVYLTIDTNIQMFTEQALSKLESASYLEWATISVVNAKTGEILGVASSPSFDPNVKDIKSYYDPFVSYTYEPGSTMKIFSFMDAVENGLYDEKETYASGKIEVQGYTIRDWNGTGWGEITFDQGFYGSSNVAATLLSQRLGTAKLKDFYTKLGYGKKTGINLPNEEEGLINFNYDIELANASFGQGMTATPVQMVQAFTCLANNGTTLKPYIVDKVVDHTTGEILFKNERTELNKVASEKTVKKMQELMWGAVNSEERMVAASGYKTDIVTTIGKTGTAQIASPNGGYLDGYYDYVRSFVGLFPYENPEIMVYVASSKIHEPSLMNEATKTLIEDVSTYLGIVKDDEKSLNNHVMPSYLNKKSAEAIKQLENKEIVLTVIGEGDTIINQYPSKGNTVSSNDKIFLVTNSGKRVYTNIDGWSKRDLEIYSSLLGVKFKFNGYGYAYDTNLEGREVIKGETIEISLKTNYKEEKSTENAQ